MSRILIVDDVETNRFLLEEALAGLASEVLSVESGPRALDAVRRLEPEVVVLDFQMPGMDGLETSRRIKERAGAAFTYVLLLSGCHELADAEDLARSGADGFVRKPYTLDVVRSAVREGLFVAAERRRAR
jgi:CheY-like chemotaxis protein